ncbi:MAG: FAD-dependent oxidoreductase [Sneathiellaceae bacterium]
MAGGRPGGATAAGPLDCDICVIGAGAAGLSVAAAAGMLGVRTVLVERGAMGGDCLNVGCVPSKALLAAAKMAHRWREAPSLGIRYQPPEIDFPAVMRHVHGVIDEIAPHDSVARYRALGATVLQGQARFLGRDAVEVDCPGAASRRVSARRFVIATGSRPAAPPIPGLEAVPYLTNESLFDLTALPDHLVVLGGGPIGLEMAQAFRRLGAAVTVVEAAQALGRDDPELAGLVLSSLRRDGVVLHEGAAVERVAARDGEVELTLSGGLPPIRGSHLLVAAGRRPNVEALDLPAAGVVAGPRGIEVDSRLRTANRRIFAIGDVAGGPQFTHVAGYHAGIVVRNALFRIPARVDHDTIPWVTYTDPELAWVGRGEAAARAHAGGIRILRWPYAENDRARAERQAAGMIKVIVDRKGRVLGAGVAGAHAGEVVQPWVLAVQRGMRIGAMAGAVLPYPTLGEVGKRAAGSYYMARLFSPLTRKLVGFLLRLP